MFNKVLRSAVRAGMVLGLMALTGCGAAGDSSATDLAKKKVAVTTGSTNASGTTSTTTTTAMTSTVSTSAAEPVVASLGLAGVAAIADNFDTATGLQPTAYGTVASGNVGGLPPESADPNGSFRFVCFGGQLLKDDPLMLPGQAGASHLHQFWGNTGANANSTYQSLRTTGQSTCQSSSAAPVNRTAYWMPAMLDGAGNAVKPDIIQTYYKQYPQSDPKCQLLATACVALPNGLRYTFGYNMATMTGGPTDPNATEYWMFSFECWADDIGTVAVAGNFHTIDDAVKAGCPAGAKLIIMYVAPACWDGQNVDVADHRSHVVWQTRWVAAANAYGCPADHPYLLPNFSGHMNYTTDANFVAGKWHLSSDEMLAQMTGKPVAGGTTLHFDYWEGWSPTVKAAWQQGCLNAHKSCNMGDLGNGTQIKLWYVPGQDDHFPTHQLVPVQ